MFFKDYNLYDLKALKEIHEFFLGFLKAYDEGLWQAYGVIEKQPSENAAPSSSKDQSALILKLAIALEDFLRTFFKLEEEVFSKDRDFEELYDLKRNTIQRLFLKKYEAFSTIPQEYTFTTQEQFIKDLKRCLSDQVLYALDLESLGKYAAFACLSKEGQKKHKNHLLFKIPHKLDPFNLIQLEKIDVIARNGFDHTDTAITKQEALNNASYCIKCHEQGKDSCSKGMASKEDSNIFTKNSFSKEMKGCPLRQKISEMNVLVQEGHTLAALAVICIDNPLLALTGHRICNACMKACIFQRQTPVDIPCVESNVLQEVLELNYGFEIYSLLTRWNPLNFKAPLPKKSSGHTVAVVGLGPAGIAMSHYMMQEGHHVIALDGLKIDPLRELPAYIKSFKELKIPLSRRNPDGFGGVMSYGITVRWDKNLLLLVRLLLERRANFKYFSGVALGQNITLKQLKEKGLSHVALCLGAGNATLLNLPHQLAPGIKLASDFLMSLHLNAPYKNEGANLEIELPCLVIGGGLTAIDAATEAKAYYAIQVEKIALKVRELKEKGTFEVFKDSLCLKDQEKLERFILHGTELLNNPSSKEDLLKKWGGVHVVYRNPIVKAPCYTLNHEEVIKALEEGIEFKENLTPISFNLDAFGALKSITFKQDERLIELESKSALLAIGTSLKIYEEEDDFEGFISYYGDMHKGYSGNVVQALASVKDRYEAVSKTLAVGQGAFKASPEEIYKWAGAYFKAVVLEVKELSPRIYELLIKAPSCAQNFKPGQFFKLQRFIQGGQENFMEPLALTGSWVEGDILSLIVLEVGASTTLCKSLKAGEKVILMGPSGKPTPIVENKKVLLVGGGLGNAVLFSIAKALKEKGCFVTYIAGYKESGVLFKREKIESFSDEVIWCCDTGVIPSRRVADKTFKGNVVEGLLAYKDGLKAIDYALVIGSDGMMRAVSSVLTKEFENLKDLYASINAPMQCMMKGVCGQCLQRQVDPITKEEKYVYTCACQDQLCREVDFDFLRKRLEQNKLQERLFFTTSHDH